MRATALSVIFAIAAGAQSPEVVSFVRSLGSALTQAHDADGLGRPDASVFLDKFDPNMPGYSTLRDQVETLITRSTVGASIEILKDDGDDRRRSLQLDWILEVQDERPRRALVKCTIERQKKDWKITSFDPIDFFKD